ncbi:extracellular solute-binding protein [Paenibacillus sp. IB182496]|uniref:Extracellular solute-binding protein n=1 Tax=Paenibacillus sabuli TaxID=2772509 RepID=A0A927BQ92_9BACL|nr:extracellular solute-binding protein [Paenibacillus sabuli]MBD2843700.1 extracellular solute-binding protein [Paenibacillus sabuli]
MKKQASRLAMLALALTLLFGLLAACSGGANEPESGADGANGTDTESAGGAAEEPMDITWLSFNPPTTDDTPVQQYLEEKYNIRITNIRIDRASWNDQLNPKLAAQEIPDVFFMWSDRDINNYARQGLLREIPLDSIREAMPQYAADVDDIDPMLWSSGQVDGKNYALPQYFFSGSLPFVPAYNGKWLKAIGRDEAPKTLEEFEDVIRQFTTEDPDGNGRDDTYGISSNFKDGSTNAFNEVFAAFGIQPFMWIENEAGELEYGLVTEQARQAFKKLHAWMEAGWIDPEYITSDTAKHRNDFVNGKYGVFSNMYYVANPVNGAVGKPFTEKDPANEIVMGPVLQNIDGSPGAGYSWGVKNNFIGLGIGVDDAKAAKLLEIFNDLYSDEETYLKTVYGFEGESYDMVDGVPQLYPEYTDPVQRGAQLGAGSYYGLFGSKAIGMAKYDSTKEDIAFRDKYTEGQPAISNKVTFNLPSGVDYPDLSKIQVEYFVKLVSGEVNTGSGFDDFVALWKRSGGEVLTEEANEIYASLKAQAN